MEILGVVIQLVDMLAGLGLPVEGILTFILETVMGLIG